MNIKDYRPLSAEEIASCERLRHVGDSTDFLFAWLMAGTPKVSAITSLPEMGRENFLGLCLDRKIASRFHRDGNAFYGIVDSIDATHPLPPLRPSS
jgi:hypothetical protein